MWIAALLLLLVAGLVIAQFLQSPPATHGTGHPTNEKSDLKADPIGKVETSGTGPLDEAQPIEEQPAETIEEQLAEAEERRVEMQPAERASSAARTNSAPAVSPPREVAPQTQSATTQVEPTETRQPAAPARGQTAAFPQAITHQIQLSTTPPDAYLSVNGRRVNNPYGTQLPRGTVFIRAQKEGYHPASMRFDLTEDRTLNIQLRSKTPPAPPPETTPEPRPPNTTHQGTQGTSPPAEPSTLVTDNPY